MRSALRRARAASLLLAVLLPAGCGPAARAPRARLSPDSAAALQRAIRMARPAFATQSDALRAGVYAAAPAPGGASPPAAPTVPPEGAFVIQIAAFRDAASAEGVAAVARRDFPDLTVVVEVAGGVHRVALAGWPSTTAAEAALTGVRARFPTAWVRQRPLP